MDAKKITTPIIIALLGFNSFLLLKLISQPASYGHPAGMNPEMMAMPQNSRPAIPMQEGMNSAIPMQVSSALQSLSTNLNEIRLTQEKIQKTLVKLDNGRGILVVDSENDQNKNDQVVENSAENMEAFSQANQALDVLMGGGDINGGVLIKWTTAMPRLTDQQRATLRNRIAAGVENGDIDPSAVSRFSLF